MSGHTPGPWKVVNEYSIMDSDHYSVASTWGAENGVNNARLIAAATELLAALVYILGPSEGALLVNSRALSVNQVRQARAAITKATGQ